MNKDTVKGEWNQIKGYLREKWSELTDDEIGEMKGSYEELAGAIEKKYGYGKDRIKQEIDAFMHEHSETK